MKLFRWLKDGGPESRVHGLFLVEIKSLFSVVLLRFSHGTRDAYHSHAFNAVSWLLRGRLVETYRIEHGTAKVTHRPSWRPIWTPRERLHQVRSEGTSWVLSFRGPWSASWREYLPGKGYEITLTHGRRVIEGRIP
jgi:hypothetical protein